ncbi:MAG: alpha/beta hydrolase [Bacteroidota bacterium]
MKLLLILIFPVLTTLGFAQQETTVKIKTKTGKLHGSLLIPESKESTPVVLIIPGSGPTDRDGNSMMVQANSYRYLAQQLGENDIASLRYDKRGVGESSQAAIEEEELRFETMVNDVVQTIGYLKKKHTFNSIILLGHSQGSLLGILAAQQEGVDGFISLSGAGRPINQILLDQISSQSPDFEEESKKILDSLKKGKTVDDFSPQLQSLFRKSIQPFLISWMKYDPAKELSKINVPKLIVQGGRDIQVADEEAKLLSKNAGTPPQIIEDMNHVLKKAPAERQGNINTYYNPDLPLHEGLMPVIVPFIQNL